MTLREKLEQIWNRPGVIHPCNINVWKWGAACSMTIFCSKGRRGPQLGPKPKGKGYSFLPRNYGSAFLGKWTYT